MMNLICAKLYVNSEKDGGKILPLNHKLGFFSVLGFKKNSGYFSGRIYFGKKENVYNPGSIYDVKVIFLLQDCFFKKIDYSNEFFVSIIPTITFGKIIIPDDEIKEIKNKIYSIYENFCEKKSQLENINFSVLSFEQCFYEENLSIRCKNYKKFEINGELFIVAKRNCDNNYFAIEILENKIEHFVLIRDWTADGKYSIVNVYDVFEKFMSENIKEFK